MSQEIAAMIRQGSILKYLLKQTAFMFVGVLFLASFTLIDLFFIGKLGAPALAAVSFASTVVMTIISFLLGFGAGVSAVVSNKIGEAKPNVAAKFVMISLQFGLLIGLVLAGLGYLFHHALFTWLGANNNTLPLIGEYMFVLYPAFFFLTLLVVVLSAIRASGDTKIISQLIGLLVIINLFLDPLLIFGWGPVPAMGIKGAAIATAFSILASLFISVFKLKIIFHNLSFNSEFWQITGSGQEILKISLPIAGTNLILPIGNTLLTKLISNYGQHAVAAFGISYRVDMITILFFSALTATLTPFLGQNRGNGNQDRIRKGIAYSLGILIIYSLITAILLLVWKEQVGKLFAENPQILEFVESYFTIVPWGYSFNGIVMVVLAVLNVFYKPLQAAGLAILHLFLMYIPLAFILSNPLALDGIFLANPFSYLLATAVGLWLLRPILSKKRRLNKI